jgi:hypothetical protein
MNWFLDVFSLDCQDDNTVAALAACQRLERESGQARTEACEDDVEVTCPYVGIMPEESYKENGSPLKF